MKIFSDKDTFEKYFIYVVLAIISAIIFSILEIFTTFRLPISPLSEWRLFFDKGYENNEHVKIVWNNLPTSYYWNPNRTAALMVIVMPFVLFLKSLYKYFIILPILIILFTVGSRAALFGCFIQFFIYFVFYPNKRSTLSFLCSQSIIPSIVLLLIFFYDTLFVQNIIDVYIDVYNYLYGIESDFSIRHRTKINKEVFYAIINSWGFGVGAGGAQYIILKDEPVALHNYWLEIAATGGIVFFVCYVVWYMLLIYNLFVIGNKINYHLNYYAKSLCLALIGFALASIGPASVVYFLPMWLLFGMSLFLIDDYRKFRY